MKFPSTVALSAALAFFAPHDVRAAQCLEFASVSTNAKLQVNITNLPTPFVVAGLKYSYDLTNLTGNSAMVVQGFASYPVGGC